MDVFTWKVALVTPETRPLHSSQESWHTRKETGKDLVFVPGASLWHAYSKDA